MSGVAGEAERRAIAREMARARWSDPAQHRRQAARMRGLWARLRDAELATPGPRVLNARVVVRRRAGAVYVGRPSRWGNPFVAGRDGPDGPAVVAKYRAYVLGRPDLIARLGELRGMDLICWCAPAPCHADVLLELASRLSV
jgi:hypothetical protein